VSARDAILSAVRTARPPAVAAPAARTPDRGDQSSLIDLFTAAATAAGAVVTRCVPTDLAKHVPTAERVLSVVPGVSSTVAIPDDPHALADLTLFVCQAALGVAENGAVWVVTDDAWYRAALFLAERVVIVLAESTIVSDLHEAYACIDIRAKSFGAFIAGPSKTADIEQALVIGAHGPKELSLIVVA
jgi:L-lactate dehydrogenase complex protein LldG